MEKIELVSRAIDEALHGRRTDEEWRERWKWYTDPHGVRMGGPWYILTAAQAAIKALKTETN